MISVVKLFFVSNYFITTVVSLNVLFMYNMQYQSQW